MKIAVLANLKQNAPTWEGMPPDRWDDLDSPKTINSIVEALKSGGHQAEFFEASIRHHLVDYLEDYHPDLCFNIAEGHLGDSRESHIPALLEMMRIPYTGSGVLALALTLDKPMTKRILTYHDLPNAEFMVLETPDDPIDKDLLNEDGELRFAMFVKPSREGTGMGVSAESIVYTVAELRQQVGRLLEQYHQPILCERYIQGREITVGLIGNLKPPAARRLTQNTAPFILPKELKFFPPLEVDTHAYGASEAGLYTNRIKTALVDTFHYTCPASIDPVLEEQLYRLTAAVFRVTDCKDVARVDFRLDENNQPYILEINPLPGLNPGYSDLCLEAAAANMSYEELINSIVSLAAARYGLS